METGLEIWDQPYEGPYSSDEDQFLDGDENPSAKRLSTTKKAMRQKRLRPQGGTSNNLQRAFATAATTKASFSTPQLPEKNVFPHRLTNRIKAMPFIKLFSKNLIPKRMMGCSLPLSATSGLTIMIHQHCLLAKKPLLLWNLPNKTTMTN